MGSTPFFMENLKVGFASRSKENACPTNVVLSMKDGPPFRKGGV
jgi:hypothetical protein